MCELIRVFKKKMTYVLLVVLVLLEAVMFFVEETKLISSKDILAYTNSMEEVIEREEYKYVTEETLNVQVTYDDLSGEAFYPPYYDEQIYLINRLKYQIEYSEYYDSIVENAAKILAVANDDKYEKKNVYKTISDYKDIKDIELEEGYDKNVISFSEFEYTQYLLFIFVFYIVISFFEDRKKGLLQVVRATKKGRLHLTFSRIITLASSTVAAGVVLYGILYLMTTYLYGGNNNRLLQSIPEFSECDRAITINQYFVEFILIKILIAIFIGLITFLLITIVKNAGLALTLLSIFMIVEYIGYSNIEYSSRYVTLKCFNVFSFLDTMKLYTTYHNINLFGLLIEAKELLIPTLVLVLWVSIIILLVGTFCYQSNNNRLIEYINEKILIIKAKFSKAHGVLYWETKKLLLYNKGILVVIVFFAIVISNISQVTVRDNNSISAFKRDYYDKHNNIVDDEIREDIDKATVEYGKVCTILYEAQEKLANNEIDETEYNKILYEYEKVGSKFNIFSSIAYDAEYIKQLDENKGIEGKLLNYTPYDYLFGVNDPNGYYRNNLILLLAIVLIAYCTFSYDSQIQFNKIIKSTGLGRKKSLKKRMCVVIGLTSIFSIAMMAVELYNVWLVYGLDELSAPIQSIHRFAEFPLDISIVQFLVIWYLVRCVIAVSIVLFVLLISIKSKTVMKSLWTSVLIVLVPAFLTYIGVDEVSYISVLKVMFSVNLWIEYEFDTLHMLLPTMVIIIIGVTSTYLVRNRYIYNSFSGKRGIK